VSLGILMIAFYITCAVFIIGVLGSLLYAVTRVNIFSLIKYLAREYLLIIGTSSSESALPRLIGKMEHIGVSKPVVGITVPTRYSFNLDGTAIYLTMASLFIATGMGMPMSIPEQIGLLVFMIIASKGAAGVTGAGLATLAGGLQAFRPDLVNGVGVIVGIDRFMSEGRAVTNFTGNAVALLIGTWTKQIDRDRVRDVLSDASRSTRPPSPATGTMACPPTPRPSAQGLEEAAIAEAEAKQGAHVSAPGCADPICTHRCRAPDHVSGRGAVVRGDDGVRRRAERVPRDRGDHRGDGAARDDGRDGRAEQRLVERPRARRGAASNR
jgi:aerobic C4-dicarboxylate transport protein